MGGGRGIRCVHVTSSNNARALIPGLIKSFVFIAGLGAVVCLMSATNNERLRVFKNETVIEFNDHRYCVGQRWAGHGGV